MGFMETFGSGIGLSEEDIFGTDATAGFEQIPQTPEQIEALAFLKNLIGAAPTFPTQQVAGLTDLEKFSQEQLGAFAQKAQPQVLTDALKSLSNILGAAPDVRETPGYQAFLQESERLRGLGQGEIARQGQARTGAFSLPTARQSSEFDEATNRNILAELGRRQLQQQQTQLQAIPQAANLASAQTAFPLQQFGAVQQFGGLPRNIQQQQQDAVFNQQLQTILFPFNYQKDIAGALLNQDRYVWAETPETSGLIDHAAQVAQVAAMAG